MPEPPGERPVVLDEGDHCVIGEGNIVCGTSKPNRGALTAGLLRLSKRLFFRGAIYGQGI